MRKMIGVAVLLQMIASAALAGDGDTCCLCMTHEGIFVSCQFEPTSLACTLECSDQGFENSYIGSHAFAPESGPNVCPDCDGQWPATPTPIETFTPVNTPIPTPTPIPTLPAVLTVKICTYTTAGVKTGCYVTDIQPALLPRILILGSPAGVVCEKVHQGQLINCYQLDTGK